MSPCDPPAVPSAPKTGRSQCDWGASALHLGQRLFRRLSVAVPLDPIQRRPRRRLHDMLSCGWLEGGGGRLVVRTHIERKELESRPRLTVAPGNGLERCSPMRRRWLRGHRPCVGSYGPLQLGVSIVRQCPSCLCRSGWQENSGRRSGQRQGARQVKGSHVTD